jgi:hypothetical protein
MNKIEMLVQGEKRMHSYYRELDYLKSPTMLKPLRYYCRKANEEWTV